jgi:hypothetical protein
MPVDLAILAGEQEQEKGGAHLRLDQHHVDK